MLLTLFLSLVFVFYAGITVSSTKQINTMFITFMFVNINILIIMTILLLSEIITSYSLSLKWWQHLFYNKISLHRWIYTKKVSISSDLLCSKRSIYYTNTDVKSGENSTYQELDLPREEIQYQNTTIRWLRNLQWRKIQSSFDWCN